MRSSLDISRDHQEKRSVPVEVNDSSSLALPVDLRIPINRASYCCSHNSVKDVVLKWRLNAGYHIVVELSELHCFLKDERFQYCQYSIQVR